MPAKHSHMIAGQQYSDPSSGLVWLILGFNASATARVISRRWNDDYEISFFLVEEIGVPGGDRRPTASLQKLSRDAGASEAILKWTGNGKSLTSSESTFALWILSDVIANMALYQNRNTGNIFVHRSLLSQTRARCPCNYVSSFSRKMAPNHKMNPPHVEITNLSIGLTAGL